MKKLLLFALLAPLAMQTSVQGAAAVPAAQVSGITKFFQPWIEAANKPLRGRELQGMPHISFNAKVDVCTFGLAFLSFLYGVGFEKPFRDSKSGGKYLAHNLFDSWLPVGLGIHEAYKRGTMLVKGKHQEPASYLIGFAKLILCFVDKEPFKTYRDGALRAVNFLPSAPVAVIKRRNSI